jgi:ion channel-forming bestrophin family protein
MLIALVSLHITPAPVSTSRKMDGRNVKLMRLSSVNSIALMNDVLVTTDRILNTPLPLVYAIAISQLTWVYILILPFQLYKTLGMVAIPGTLCEFDARSRVYPLLQNANGSIPVAAYIIFGFAFIGQQIENTFGHDVNDLPLDAFCNHLAADIDIIASSTPQYSGGFIKNERNSLMHPLNNDGFETWKEKGVDENRKALRKRSLISMKSIKLVDRRRIKGKSSESKYEMVASSTRDVV